jgi:hypothetical protein
LNDYLVNNINSEYTEQAVKKVMSNIVCGRSVLLTKTDLTQICNKPGVRLEAVKRLIGAGLLEHGENYWLETTHARKGAKKHSKHHLREGWMK